MDFFEQIAREQVRAMILNHARREDLSQIFSQGEMRLLGCLNAGADGRTAGELSTLLDLSTARIAAMLNNLERIADHADNLASSVESDHRDSRLLW